LKVCTSPKIYFCTSVHLVSQQNKLPVYNNRHIIANKIFNKKYKDLVIISLYRYMLHYTTLYSTTLFYYSY